jgi:hypothetical protein
MENNKNNYYETCDGTVSFWIEQEAIHIKAVDKFGDPVELTKERALELADNLKRLASTIT